MRKKIASALFVASMVTGVTSVGTAAAAQPSKNCRANSNAIFNPAQARRLAATGTVNTNPCWDAGGTAEANFAGQDRDPGRSGNTKAAGRD